MAIADTLSDFLIDQDIDYHVFPHAYTESASEAARAAHVPPARVAKAVVIANKDGGRRRFRLVVLPATHEIDMHELEHCLHEHLELAKEYELPMIFPDCAVGAVPIIGEAYGLQTIVDQSLLNRSEDIFFEAGDHEELIRLSADQFNRLMSDALSVDIVRRGPKYSSMH